MKRIDNYYFKDDGSHAQYISGIALPTDKDGTVRRHLFVNCSFHPVCSAVRFEKCKFVDCDFIMPVDKYKMEKCQVIETNRRTD